MSAALPLYPALLTNKTPEHCMPIEVDQIKELKDSQLGTCWDVKFKRTPENSVIKVMV